VVGLKRPPKKQPFLLTLRRLLTSGRWPPLKVENRGAFSMTGGSQLQPEVKLFLKEGQQHIQYIYI
jgi:hypothetical protein